MKVLYLVPQPKRPDRIGAYTFLDEEIQALAHAGVEAYVLSTAVPDDRWCDRVRLLSVRTRSSHAVRLAAAAFLVRSSGRASGSHLWHPVMWYRSSRMEHLATCVIEQEGIDVIHSHFAWPQGFGGSMAAAATGRPLVACLRGTDILIDREIGYGRRRKRVFDQALRGLLRSADRTLYFSDYMREQAIALGAPAARARVVRKGVDLDRFFVAQDRTALKRELGLADRPMILTVGGLIPRKGIDVVLKALARLRAAHHFTFVVCGDGPERARLEGLAAQLGLADRVVFAGRVGRDDIAKYFAACDVFALASTIEAAGNVLFEAMASARPVVCTNAGGPQEYVKDGVAGYVVPVGDIEALADRIRQLLEQPALADNLGRQGRERTLGQFSYRRMVNDVISVYEDVLREPSQQRMAG